MKTKLSKAPVRAAINDLARIRAEVDKLTQRADAAKKVILAAGGGVSRKWRAQVVHTRAYVAEFNGRASIRLTPVKREVA